MVLMAYYSIGLHNMDNTDSGSPDPSRLAGDHNYRNNDNTSFDLLFKQLRGCPLVLLYTSNAQIVTNLFKKPGYRR